MRFDQVILNPTAAELVGNLRAAAVAAGRLSKKAVKALSESEEQQLLRQLSSAAGEAVHKGNGKFRLPVAWWTDPAGRKHVRVMGYLADDDFGGDEGTEEPPAVARVYPGSLLFVEADGDDPVSLVVCGCGTIGTPEAVAWMGETCGPCADAKAEGREVPHPLVRRGVGGGSAVMKATPDGRGLILSDKAHRLVYLDLPTGEQTTSEPTRGENLCGIALAPDAESCLAGYWSNHLVRWNWRNNTLKRHGEPLSFSQFHVSPDNAHAVTGESGTLFRIDWQDARTPLKLEAFLPGRHGGFSRDGAVWVYLSEEHQFLERHLVVGYVQILRADVFEELESLEDWQQEMLQVQHLDADNGWAIIAGNDPEHGTFGPAYLGPVSLPGEWRELPYDDDGSDNNMPAVFGFTPGGEYALYRDEAGRLVFFPTEEEGETVYRVAFPVPVVAYEGGLEALTFSPDGGTLHATVAARGVNLVVSFPWRLVLAAAGSIV
ncbi:NHL repeat-containing protein [Limnoglobus roseus]|uniref:WD40 repeat domain-containing protein n=1 Tax=Limnoglobus roseus TaxID=2598579 RepID=A0A5C1A3W2_9BACT|nr:hypothetical protein [Limnoglobus roseus]QEL13290.1 WD40 repeat domain-containing protein [Limnoglobus roseus]